MAKIVSCNKNWRLPAGCVKLEPMGRNGNANGNGGVTLRLLRDLRKEVGEIKAKMVTKDEFVREASKINGRVDLLTRVVKDNHRVMSKRVRAVEIR